MGFYLVQLLTGLAGAAGLFLVAVGLSIVFGVTRIVNFAHGSFFMLGAYLGLDLVTLLGRTALGFWGGIVLAALAVGVVGVVVEVLVLRRLYAAPELFQLLATFGVLLVIQDAALWIWGPVDRLGPRAPGLRGAVRILGEHLPRYDLVLIAAGPVILGLLWLLFHRTRWGILVRAATADREMVAALGVDQRRLFTTTFFLGACLAGLGGALQLPTSGANLLMDTSVIGTAFVVVVIGGMGSILGAFLAAVLVGEIQALGVLVFPQGTLVLVFLLMAVVLVLRPQGLFGRAEPPPAHPGGMAAASGGGGGVLGVVLALLLVLPLVLPGWTITLMTEMVLMALFAASLHAIMGPGGLASFGHAAYFGAGAYAAALLSTRLGAPMALALPGGVLGAALLALLAGWLCVRLRGVYFAMLTLAVAQIVWSVAVQWTGVTGGDDGILGVWPPPWAAPPVAYYYLVLTLCAAAVWGLRHLARTPFGWGLRAARDHARKAEALGIDTRRQQWLGFAVAGACAGLAGALYVFAKGSVFPNELTIERSFDALMMVLLGGVNAAAGPLAGAAAFTGLHDLLGRFFWWRAMLGLTIIALVLIFPDGLAGGMGRLRRRLAGGTR